MRLAERTSATSLARRTAAPRRCSTAGESGTLAARGGPALALGIVLVLAAAGSSFLVIRNAPVGPDSHAGQLESLRGLVADEPVLFLGRDDFIGWELRGSGEITGIVTNFYDVEDARPRIGLWRHLFTDHRDRWQILGGIGDGLLRAWRAQPRADCNVFEPKETHRGLLDPALWTARGWWKWLTPMGS